MAGRHGKQGDCAQVQHLARLRSQHALGGDTERYYLLDHVQRNDKARTM